MLSEIEKMDTVKCDIQDHEDLGLEKLCVDDRCDKA